MKNTKDTGINEIADAIIKAANLLGNGNASTPMGAIEAHGLMVNEGCGKVATGLHDIAEALRELTELIREQTGGES
jgi:spore maturation protein SpmA